ncbi:hydantoinase/oxoprolinase family protein [Marinibacterium sp. SX1]|uniref:hydantoinase/oxoprolinase family protein n=1 Tax=Marinibacterium sp. SX1 TaxID=3388424 RepID=UPI003D173700
MSGIRIAADIGGTFTDVACLHPDGRLVTRKVPSTPQDYAAAIVDTMDELAGETPFAEILHASTVATNAILEGKGARTALITTRGFRDVLELRRIRVPRLYEPLYEKPAPLVPRRLRFELTERMDARGQVLTPLDSDETEALIAHLATLDVEAVAVCFLHAHVNDAHERALAARLRAAFPDRFISVSSEVLPEIREYERCSTTVANAYIGPPVARYLRSLSDRLKAAGQGGRLLMMQSSGGVQQIETIIARPATVVESGPAAGVVGVARMGARAGYERIITFDMGGTTAKAAMIEDGRIASTSEYEVGGGISLSSRLVKGGGYALKLPVVDVSEVGAGGGSMVRVDAAGALRVGPESAGAHPGPLCYGRGGTAPTVTDANVVLGYLNPEALAGGTVPIDAGAARQAFAQEVAPVLGCDMHQAAFGVHRLANVSMMRAVKAVSTYRGRDPRDFTLFCFGGNGGVHGAMIARELDMTRVVVPPAAGVYSAVGLLFADFEASRSRAFLAPFDAAMAGRAGAVLEAMQAEVATELDDPEAVIRWSADLRYTGQAFELPIDLPRDVPLADALEDVRRAFDAEHEKAYGHAMPGKGLQVVNLRVLGSVAPPTPGGLALQPVAPPPPGQSRTVHFGETFGLCDTPILRRHDLDATPRQGPAIIEEYEGTTVVPPDATVHRDGFDNIVIDYGDRI